MNDGWTKDGRWMDDRWMMDGRKEGSTRSMDGRIDEWMNGRKINTSDTMDRLKGLKRSTRPMYGWIDVIDERWMD